MAVIFHTHQYDMLLMTGNIWCPTSFTVLTLLKTNCTINNQQARDDDVEMVLIMVYV